MQELEVGIRIQIKEGISFIGIEQVNDLITRGGVVTELQPGGALMQKLGEDDEHVRLTLSGCTMKVIVDDSNLSD